MRVSGPKVALFLTGLAGLAAAGIFRQDMRRHYARIAGRSALVASPFGNIEYLQGGEEGRPVLVVHGSGGGFDQGELLARALLPPERRWLAPSRFGYLQSSLPEGATFEKQARAFVCLLDALGIEQVDVVAISHGGPAALWLSLLFPERVHSLALVSAGVATVHDKQQQDADWKGVALTWIYQRDYRYWAITGALRTQFLGLMGVSAEVARSLTAEERQLADETIAYMNPVSVRAAGVRFDNRAEMPNERIAGIRVPTLILHAKDDSLQLFENARYAARHISGARLVAFERGGHLLVAVEQERVREEMARHWAR